MRLLNSPNYKIDLNIYMKQATSLSKKIFFIPFCILIFFVSCHPNAKPVQQKNIAQTFKSKLIVSFCAFYVVQIQDSAFYHHGMEWTNAQGVTYQHVFTIKNYCDFSAANLKTDEIFNCTIVEKPTTESCNVCMGFMEAPSLQHCITVVK